MWFNLAAAQFSGENRDGMVEARDAVADRMTAEQIAAAQRRAREWDADAGTVTVVRAVVGAAGDEALRHSPGGIVSSGVHDVLDEVPQPKDPDASPTRFRRPWGILAGRCGAISGMANRSWWLGEARGSETKEGLMSSTVLTVIAITAGVVIGNSIGVSMGFQYGGVVGAGVGGALAVFIRRPRFQEESLTARM